MNNTNPFIIIVYLLSSIVLISACTPELQKEDEQTRRERHMENQTPKLNFDPEPPKNIVIKQGNLSKSAPTTIFSDKKKYKVTLYSKIYPFPVQKIHSWVIHIETADGIPVTNATVFVHGGMPVHRHGFPVQPRVKKHLGNGDYLVKGIKFNMIGDWEIRININEKTRRDRAVFWFPVK